MCEMNIIILFRLKIEYLNQKYTFKIYF